jgi:acetolactate synthase-1/2/3 large subunit
MLVTRYIITYLKKHEVQTIFGVGGANIEDLYDAIFHYGEGMQAVVAKHEFSAVTMADGYSRASGKLGVVVATSGGGAFNLISGIAESFASSIPLLAIVGQVPQHLEGKGGFQDSSGLNGSIPAEKVFQPVSKYCQRITHTAQIPQALHDAVHAALERPQGPAVLLIPKNLQNDNIPSFSLTTNPNLKVMEDYQRKLSQALNFLCSPSSTVTVICGEMSVHSAIKPLVNELAMRLQAYVAVTATAKTAFDNQGTSFVGVVGIMGHPSTIKAIKQTNTCILIGARLSAMDYFGLQTILSGKNIIYINSEKPFLDYHHHRFTWLEFIGDISCLLEKLVTGIASQKVPLKRTYPIPLEYLETQSRLPQDSRHLRFKEVMCVLSDEIESTANIVVDAGNTGAAAVHFIKAPQKGTFTIALGMGGMGYSFGAAIGACIANQKKTYVIAGDGAFFMHGSEIHTAVELTLPIVFIIINNNAHAMCMIRESIYYNAPYSYNKFKKTMIGAGIHAMFPSIPTFTITTIKELKEALDQLRENLTPSFLCIEMDPMEIPPFEPFSNTF